MSQHKFNPNVSSTLGYVELKVSNLDKSIEFYEKVIGLKVIDRQEAKAVLSTDAEKPLLTLTEDKNAAKRPYGTTGLFHFAILVPTREDLALTLKHLLESGYPVQGASDHQYSEAVYLSDLDNNGIEIYADRNPSDWLEDGKGGYVGGTYQMDVDSVFSEIKERKWNGLPRGTKLGHMHLQVSSIEESEKFYVNGLGFDIVAKDRRMLFLSKDRYHHHIGLNTWAGIGLPKPPKNSLGLQYFIVRFTNEDFENAQKNLQQLGYSFEKHEDEIVVEDPSGNVIKVLNNK